MGIAAAAYNVNGYSNKNVATIIILGFSEQLKNWWDNYLSHDERRAIINHTIDQFDEDGEIIQYAYETLIHTITLHFSSFHR